MSDKPLILVVDDEQRFRENLVKILKINGFKAIGAEGGTEALDLLARESVDVVLLDVKMPGMSGLEVLARIKASSPLVEVIVLSGHASVETAREIISLGGFDYLLKPHSTDDLIHKVEEAYEKRLNRIKLQPAISHSTS